MNTYIGRFAPSPTGLLHIGSLMTALASYADARAVGGRWLVRMEDLDPPREMAGAATHILHTLEAFGFEWDGSVLYQSSRHEAYRERLEQLKRLELCYPCTCSRKQWQQQAATGTDGLIYRGHCAGLPPQRLSTATPHAWRMRTPDETVSFDDRIVGTYRQNPHRDIGDFVLLRADGFWAYQLAVVCDDAEQGITDIVRGQDLLVSTPRQIVLQRALGLPRPRYAHLPLLTNALGQKWSKQTLAPAVSPADAESLLRRVSGYLKLPPAPAVNRPRDLLDWAAAHWDTAKIPVRHICTENPPPSGRDGF